MSLSGTAFVLFTLLVSTACVGVDAEGNQSTEPVQSQTAEQELVGQRCSPTKEGPSPVCSTWTEFCNVGSACGHAGFCATRPTICPTLYAPVCGCDKKTYSSACVAARNGVSVEHQGPCYMPL